MTTDTNNTVKAKDTKEAIKTKDAFDELHADWKEEGITEGEIKSFNTPVNNLMNTGIPKKDATSKAKQLLSLK